jgi:nucleotide-binding universal stress UspA family protein
MIDIRHILCPIDFSDYSRRALDHALAIARWYESTVTVLHVYSPVPAVAFSPGPVIFEPTVFSPVAREQLVAETKVFIDKEAARGITIEAVVRAGTPAAAIVDEAIRINADLLVMGTHGRSGFDRLLLGAVAERVLRKASCPVMTVPGQLPGALPAAPVLYKRILCPVDFSTSSLHALKYATSMTHKIDGQLTVVHVVEHEFDNDRDAVSGVERSGMTIGEFLQEQEERLCRRLHTLASGAPEFCKVESLLSYGKPWREVLRVAAERQSDLIVMGVQGRGTADRFFFGSTTQHVAREAPCPVLTLRCR